MPERELASIDSMPRAFLDGLGVGIVLLDEGGRFIFTNKAFAQMLGYSSAELVKGTQISDLTHPDDRARSIAELQRLIKGGAKTTTFEKRYALVDGAVLYARVTGNVISDSKGRARWVAGVVENINEQQMLRQKLDAAEGVSGLATWNWVVEVDSTDASPAYRSLYGFAAATSSSLEAFLHRVHPEDRKSVESTIRSALKRRIGYTQEYRVLHETAGVRWLRSMVTCLTNGKGKVTNLVGATLDITETRLVLSQEAPKQMRDAIEYMTKNWDKPLSLRAIASSCGVSVRKIQREFTAQGTTPMRFLKQLKLRHAYEALKNPDSHTTVTSVALRCGFANLGHFANDYRLEFGELPSKTLQNSS